MKRLLACSVLMLLLACGTKPQVKEQISLVAEDIGFADCAACGMVVAEQPAPRAQLVHRNGKRVFFCAIGDMLRYREVPSPYGKPAVVFVEIMEPDTDPLALSDAPRPWRHAEEVTYVADLPRKGIMGDPLMTYAANAQAEAVAKSHQVRTVSWEELTREDH